MKTMIRASSEPWSYGVSLRMAQKNEAEGGRLYVAQPLVFQERAPASPAEPFVTLDREDAQLLMDELWSVGLRPSEGTGSAGAMAATERHLHDMQEIAKGALKKAGVL